MGQSTNGFPLRNIAAWFIASISFDLIAEKSKSRLTCVLAPEMIGFGCLGEVEISSTTSSDSDWLLTFSLG